MSFTSDTVLILIGALFLLIGLLGGGIEISAVKVPSAGKLQRAVLAVAGIVLIAVGVNYIKDQPAGGSGQSGVPPTVSPASAPEPAASEGDAAASATEPPASASSEGTPASESGN